jgi:aspartate/methionine/tyrosine aminotransferase
VLRLAEEFGAERVALELLDQGVVVHPGYFYDFEDDRHFVVSLIGSRDELVEAMRRWRARG